MLPKAKNLDISESSGHLIMDSCPQQKQLKIYIVTFFFFFFFLVFSRATPAACGGSQARGSIRAVATGLCQSHSNMGSQPRLQRLPQLTAMPDP